ncbi:MAG TPA: aspartate dehydrogenase [Methylomirabilota bacterium]|jgi:aspartate dehydrogenase|nr:aspartate dehydrogenase [Methylomirabilota bacterium]
MPGTVRPPLTVAVGGFGAIGRAVARHLDAGIPGLTLTAVSARDVARATARVAGLARPVPVVPLGTLAGVADVVVECAPAATLREVAEPALRAGRTLLVVSVGALLSALDLVDLARAHGAQIIVPSGAILGLDAVTAAAEGEIRSVRMITRKPVQGLEGAPYLEAHGISLRGITEPVRVFAGSAREGARGFPANVNVAAALGLAGIGPDRTELEIWADPGLTRNTHRIEVVAESATFSMAIENVPSEENPRTGRITALSVVAALRKLVSPLRVGT